MSYVERPMKSKYGVLSVTLTSATHAHIDAPRDTTVYRGKLVHFSLHVNLKDGEWVASERIYVGSQWDGRSKFKDDLTWEGRQVVQAQVLSDFRQWIEGQGDELQAAEVGDQERALERVEGKIKDHTDALVPLFAERNAILASLERLKGAA